tara:strand:- start:224 stop:436 length:213 start_codon:yes stop_codon:yes gene_type:complete
MIKRKFILILTILFTTNVFAQTVREIDLDNEPVDFTDPAKFIALIVIPLFIVIAGSLIYWKWKKRKKNEE